MPFDLRYFLLRVSSHSLRIQTGCYGNDLLLKFPCFIPRYYYNRISIFILIELLKSENRNALIKLCKVIKLAFNHRNSLISRYSSTLNIFVHPLFCDVVI